MLVGYAGRAGEATHIIRPQSQNDILSFVLEAPE